MRLALNVELLVGQQSVVLESHEEPFHPVRSESLRIRNTVTVVVVAVVASVAGGELKRCFAYKTFFFLFKKKTRKKNWYCVEKRRIIILNKIHNNSLFPLWRMWVVVRSRTVFSG